jgi:hypothetical protein
MAINAEPLKPIRSSIDETKTVDLAFFKSKLG